MSSITLIIILAVAPIAVIYLFYHRYFIVKPSYLYHLEYFIYGVILALVILLASPLIMPHLVFQNTIAMGFLGASMIEKLGAFVFIAILMLRESSIMMVLNMAISAMLLGLGFATLENIVYALAMRDPVVVVRLFSSVPLHVLTCGLIGYGLALFRFSGSFLIKARYAVTALVVPFLFHGLYDTMLLTGGTGTYWIAPLLVLLIIGMEYILAKSQTLPLLDGLRKHSFYIEDWVTVQREPQYERWILRSMGSRNREYVPLFRLSIGRIRVFFILVLLACAAISIFGQRALIGLLGNRLRVEESVMLFTLLPALYSLNLFAIGVMNPKYFQNSIIKIPIIIDVDVEAGGTLIKTIAYHVTGENCYLKTVDPLAPGSRMMLTFACSAFSSPQVAGEVIWDSHDEQKQLSGSLVRLSSRSAGFRLFLVKYYLYRISRGLSFNMRLPGFRSIRQLFVRPISVMQKEWRFSAGQKLFEQGEEGKIFYLIRKGEVDIIKSLDTGERVTMATLKEGDIFGEMAIVGNQPRLATAVCRTDCLLAVAEADNLDALIEGNPVFTQKLIKNFANRLHASEEIMLKSMADSGAASKRREEALMALCRVLAAVAGTGGDASSLMKADAGFLAKQLNMDKKLVEDILHVFSVGKDAAPEERMRSILEKIENGRDRV